MNSKENCNSPIDELFSERKGRDVAAMQAVSCKKTLNKVKESLSKIVIDTLCRLGYSDKFIESYLKENKDNYSLEIFAERIIDIVAEKVTGCD